jgi:hypothetical protein
MASCFPLSAHAIDEDVCACIVAHVTAIETRKPGIRREIIVLLPFLTFGLCKAIIPSLHSRNPGFQVASLAERCCGTERNAYENIA